VGVLVEQIRIRAKAGLGLVSSVVTCPLDVIKTKLQAQSIAHGGHGYLGIRGVYKLRDRLHSES
jgi:hypothetical protein